PRRSRPGRVERGAGPAPGREGPDARARVPRRRRRPPPRRSRRRHEPGRHRGRTRGHGNGGRAVSARPIELNLLRYVPGTSVVHRLWAGTKVLAVATLSLTLSLQP